MMNERNERLGSHRNTKALWKRVSSEIETKGKLDERSDFKSRGKVEREDGHGYDSDVSDHGTWVMGVSGLIESGFAASWASSSSCISEARFPSLDGMVHRVSYSLVGCSIRGRADSLGLVEG